jgi:hypothetical protein
LPYVSHVAFHPPVSHSRSTTSAGDRLTAEQVTIHPDEVNAGRDAQWERSVNAQVQVDDAISNELSLEETVVSAKELG